MKALRRLLQQLRFTVMRRGSDGEMAEELESHIQMQTEENLRAGMTPQEARRIAVLKFGSVDSTKESYRDQRSLPFLETTIQDLRYAVRGIRKNPGFATVAILSLAIGIAANTAIFSLVNGVLLQPMAYKDPDRVYVVRALLPHMLGQTPIPVNPLHAYEWAKQCPSLEDVALMRSHRAQITSAGEPANISGVDVSHSLFRLLGVEPLLGRTFIPEEEREGGDPVVILSEALWRSRFSADAAIVGQTILLDNRSHQVVGIMPASLRLPYTGSNVQFEIFRPVVLTANDRTRLMGNFNYGAAVRLKGGVSAEQALAEINVVQARFPQMAGQNVELKATLTSAHELFTGRARLGLWVLAAAVGAFQLIVCLNLANLLLSRVASRGREAAIRTALGASRGRQFRQLLTESLLLAISGGLLGVLLASVLVQLLVSMTTLGLPRLDEVRVDSRVLVFAFALTLITGFVFGVLPAWRLTRGDPQEALRDGSHTVTEGRRGLRLREGLIGLEVGLSAALLIVAALLGTSLTRLLQVDKGFDADRILTVDIRLVGERYREAGLKQFFDRVLTKVGAIPGIEAFGIVTYLPTLGETWLDPIYLEGTTRPEEQHSVNNRWASPGYFRAMNIAIRKGRAFDESDRDRGVALLSEKAADILWPGEPNPIGRQFVGEDGKVKSLIGVVADVRAYLQSEPPPMAYYPYWQRVPDGVTLVVRTSADPRAVTGTVRAVLRSEDAQLPIPSMRTMEEVVDGALAQRRFQSILMNVFAASALLVASLGIYGVVSYSVARRRNEIGIRMALGAERSRLLELVIRQGMIPVVVGLVVGVGIALLLGRSIRGLLFNVQPTDPLTIVGVTVVLLVVGVLACLIPARRAAGTDVVKALRFE